MVILSSYGSKAHLPGDKYTLWNASSMYLRYTAGFSDELLQPFPWSRPCMFAITGDNGVPMGKLSFC